MIDVIIFGTGSSAENFLATLDKEKVNIVAFSDNNKDKHYTEFHKRKIIPPKEIMSIEFDYIFVASQYSVEISEQLLKYGIDYSKIIPTDIERHHKFMTDKYKKIIKTVKLNRLNDGEKIKIALVNYNNSNYNGYALYKYMPEFIKNKYDVHLIENKNEEELKKFHVICSSLYDGIYKENYINIEMWHGFPIKKIGVMDSLNVNAQFLNYVERCTKYTDIVLSYSQLYSTLFNSSFPTDISKYRITGMPRNDLLFESGSVNKLETLLNKDLSTYNIVFYMPTWRKGKNPKRIDSSRKWEDLFGFQDEDTSKIIKMIEVNRLFMVVKLHPYEYNLYKDLEVFKHEQIHLLSEDELILQKTHLYELLPSSSILITDYSSIFFDTLLLDIPVIFAPTDLEEYQVNKGFLMEPYEHFTPGATVHSLRELNYEISNLLNGKDKYKEERMKIKQLVFKYFDNKSSLRAWKVIDEYIGKQFGHKV